jgi:hypothetical protein
MPNCVIFLFDFVLTMLYLATIYVGLIDNLFIYFEEVIL